MDNPQGFLDSINFWGSRGLAYGDSVDKGKPYILTTADRGESWTKVDPENLPDSPYGKLLFTCK